MTDKPPLPLWRSMLFVPANVERYVEAAHTRSADAIIIDLEDSIIPSAKAEARARVQEVAAKVCRGGADVAVRINRPWRLAIRDLEAAVSPGVQALALPKVPDAGHVRAIADVVDELEAERGMTPGATRLIAMIETADAYFQARDIARAHPRLVGMILGSEDFALSMGMPPEPDSLLQATTEVAIAARAAGILPIGFVGTLAQYADRDAFRETLRRSRKLGFQTAFCIHPSQVEILNQEYAPTADEVAHAERVVAAFAQAEAEGRGSAQVDGAMIDVPIVVRARETLARQAAIEARHRRGPPAG